MSITLAKSTICHTIGIQKDCNVLVGINVYSGQQQLVGTMGLMSFRSARFAILAACLLTLNVDSSNFLPQGWTAHSSEGVPYYYNQNTGITQWEKPVLPSQGYSNYQPSSDQRGFNKGASGSTTTSKTYHNQRVDTTRYSSQQSQPHNQQNYGSGSVSINHNSAVSAGIPNTSTEFTQGRHNSSQTQQNVNISQLQSDEEDAVTVKQPSLVDSKENGVESTIIYNNDRINNSGSASNNLNTDEQLKREITSSNVMINSTNSSIMMGDYDSNAASINNRGQQIPANENANSVRSSEIQTFITQLKDADQKIDELNDVIDVLENEKFELQNLIEICEEIQRNITLISVAAVRNASEVHSASQLQLTNQLTAVELELEILADELELLKTAQSKLESNLIFEKEKNVKSSEILIDLQSNFTIKNEELQEKEERSKDQEKELSNVYKELAQLEEDFKNIAEPSLRRSRRPSFFKRILLQAFPVWIGGKGSVKNVRRAKGKIAAVTASEESLVAINNTIKDLRVSLKEMSVALGEKDVTIEEISEKLAEHIDEDKKR